MLSIGDSRPVAEGSQRAVYQHPERPDLLVKVIRPEYVLRLMSRRQTSWRPLGRYRQLKVFLRELREHLAAVAAHGSTPPFLQAIVGLADTDIGPGIVVRAVRDRDGRLAITLEKLIANGGFGPSERTLFDRFAQQLLTSPVVITGDNIVYEDGDEPRFVLIDGIGDTTVLRIKSHFPKLNRISKQRRINELRTWIEAELTKGQRAKLSTLRSASP